MKIKRQKKTQQQKNPKKQQTNKQQQQLKKDIFVTVTEAFEMRVCQYFIFFVPYFKRSKSYTFSEINYILHEKKKRTKRFQKFRSQHEFYGPQTF